MDPFINDSAQNHTIRVTDYENPTAYLETNKNVDGITLLYVQMRPLPETANMVNFWSDIAKTFPNIQGIRIDFGAASLQANSSILVHDLTGLASLLEAYQPNLQQLHLSVFCIPPHPPSSKCISHESFVAAVRSLTALRIFNFFAHYGHRFDSSHLVALFGSLYNPLMEAVGSLQSLHRVDISGGYEPTNGAPFSRVLREIHLSNLPWKAEWMNGYLEGQSNLSSISVDFGKYSSEVGDPKNIALGELLAGHPTLKKVKFDSMCTGDINPACFEIWHSFNANLGNNSQLQDFHLGCDVPDEILGQLFIGLTACQSLKSIELRPKECPTPQSTSLLARLLASKSWQSIRLYCVGDFPRYFAHTLGSAIIAHQGIVKLFKLRTFCTIEGWEILVAAATSSAVVEELDIEGKLFDIENLIQPAMTGIVDNGSLRCIRLYDWTRKNWERSDSSLFHCLQKSYAIKQFCVHGMSAKTQQQCEIICRLNFSGRQYLVDCDTKENGVNCLVKLQDGFMNASSPELCSLYYRDDKALLDCIYFHLRENATCFFGKYPEVDSVSKARKRIKIEK